MSGSVVVVIPPELEPGFQLAGVESVVALTAAEAAVAVERMIDDTFEGVVAVYEPYLSAFAAASASRADRSLTPVVVGLPAGIHEPSGEARRARLAELLTRAVGYQVTFGSKDES